MATRNRHRHHQTASSDPGRLVIKTKSLHREFESKRKRLAHVCFKQHPTGVRPDRPAYPHVPLNRRRVGLPQLRSPSRPKLELLLPPDLPIMATRNRHRHHRTRWPRQTPAASQRNSVEVTDGSIASPWTNKKRKHTAGQEQKQEDYGWPSLPEDIWCHIHSLLPLRDAARAACVSHVFRCSWRRLPSLTFSEASLGLTRNAGRKEGISGEFARKVDHILKNRSRTGLRTLELRLARYNAKDPQRLDRWLEMMTVTPGIEEITVALTSKHGTYYRFPCSLLSDGKGDSVRHLSLSNCSFCPTAGLWSSGNLAVLDLTNVDVTGDRLRCLLSYSIALERVSLMYCSGITCLEIPGSLRRLGYLEVVGCDDLRAVESKAPNLPMFNFAGDHLQTDISLGGELRVKELHVDCSSYPWFTRAKLASRSTPDTETVNVLPSTETIDLPVGTSSSKSAHLERLYIEGVGKTPFYLSIKYCALVSLYGASHSVEDLVSYVSSQLTDHVLFCGTKRSGVSVVEEQLVDGACRMLKAWLS